MPARRYGQRVDAVYRLCLDLARAGCEVRALSTNAAGLDHELTLNTAHEHAIAAGFYVRYCRRRLGHSVSPAMLRFMYPYVKWADVVHLNAVHSFATLPTLSACRMFRRPLVWSPRGELGRATTSGSRAARSACVAVYRSLIPRNTVLHATSQEERADSLAQFPKQTAAVIADGVIIPREVQHTPGNVAVRLGYVGRLEAGAGIENLIEALRILEDGGLAVKLVVAGRIQAGYESLLQERIEALRLGPEVEVLGFFGRAARRRFFERIDLAVMPSAPREGATVVAEALAHGVPVIAGKDLPWDRVEEKGCGLWVDNAPPALARAIQQMCAAPLEEMGRRGRQWMIDDFSWDRLAQSMYEVYRPLVGDQDEAVEVAPINGSHEGDRWHLDRKQRSRVH
jgi:glycosyltransferase involved in cell wall biosynthesis